MMNVTIDRLSVSTVFSTLDRALAAQIELTKGEDDGWKYSIRPHGNGYQIDVYDGSGSLVATW